MQAEKELLQTQITEEINKQLALQTQIKKIAIRMRDTGPKQLQTAQCNLESAQNVLINRPDPQSAVHYKPPIKPKLARKAETFSHVKASGLISITTDT